MDKKLRIGALTRYVEYLRRIRRNTENYKLILALLHQEWDILHRLMANSVGVSKIKEIALK